jgi:hypothetical protein
VPLDFYADTRCGTVALDRVLVSMDAEVAGWPSAVAGFAG